jgi:hypothetical protein
MPSPNVCALSPHTPTPVARIGAPPCAYCANIKSGPIGANGRE